jgi:predicted transcriptional regulator
VAGEVAERVAGMADAVEEKAEEVLEKGKDLSRESLEAVLAALTEGQERLGRQRDRLAKLLG